VDFLGKVFIGGLKISLVIFAPEKIWDIQKGVPPKKGARKEIFLNSPFGFLIPRETLKNFSLFQGYF